MKIKTHPCTTLNLHEVEQLLPSNHHLQRFGDSISIGLQPSGDYFVFSLIVFWGKKQQGNSCRARITLHDVLEDCIPENCTNVDGMVHGAFCEAMEEHILWELGPKGTWSEESPGSSRIWLVLHRMAVQPYQWTKNNRHPFLVVMGPSSTPECEMWVMVRILQHEAVPASSENETAPSLALSSVCAESTAQPPQSSTSPPFCSRETHKTPSKKSPFHLLGTPRPTSSTHPSPHAPCHKLPSTLNPSTARAPAQTESPKQISPTPGQSPVSVQAHLPTQGQKADGSQSHVEEQPPAPGSHCDPLQTSVPTKRPLQTDSLDSVKRLAQAKSCAKSPAWSKALAPDPSLGPAPARPCTSVPAQTPATVRPCAPASTAFPWKPKGKQWKLTSLIKAQDGSRIEAAGVLVEVLKEGNVAKNGNIFDSLKMTAKGMTLPSSPRTHMIVKVFHNDRLNWPEGVKLQRGQVLMFKEMLCQEHNGYLDGIIFSTKRACVFSCDENKRLTWYAHSSSNWWPQNIVNAESEARMQFDWWMTVGVKFNFMHQGGSLASKPAALHPTCTLDQAGGKGYFNLFCQVVKKTLYPSRANPKSVLRVCDGTFTQYCFEKIISDPTKKVEDHNRIFGCVGSLEVDVVVVSSIIPPEVENLQEGSFVELKGLDCVVLPEQRRQLVLFIHGDEEHIRLLDEDELQLQTIRDALDHVRGAEADAEEGCDGVSIVNSEEEMPREPRQALERFTIPHDTISFDTELPCDSFEEFVREQGYKRSSKYHTRQRESSTAKKQCLDSTTTSGTYSHPSSPSRQSLSSPFRQPLHTARQPSPLVTNQSHIPTLCSPTSKQAFSSSPQPPLSRLPLYSSSPQPSPHRQSLHSTSPQSSPSGQPQQHSSQKSPSTSRHHLHSSSPQPSTSKQPQQHPLPQKSPSTHKLPLHASTPQSHTSKHPPKHPSPQKSLSTSRQPLHPSSPEPQQNTSPQMSPSSYGKSLHTSSLIKPYATTRQDPQVAPSSPTLEAASFTYDLKEQLQKLKMGKTGNAFSVTQPIIFPHTRPNQPQDHCYKSSLATATTQQTLSFHTEVESEAKETSLENFYIEGKIGKVYSVQASIMDILTVKQRDCICGGEHVCLHQWLWGLCKKCSRTFSSYYLSLYNIPLPSESHYHLPCQSCNHECINSDGGSHRAMSYLWSTTVKPFIKIRVVIEDPSTGLQLTPWLVADDANIFFNVMPTFEWLIDKPEIQGTVEAILQQKTPPLKLGLKKVMVAGRVNLYIVNTVLFTTPSFSQPSPVILPRLQSPSATPPDPNSPSAFSLHPNFPSAICSHPDSPSVMSPHHDFPSATSPDPDAHFTVLPHPQSPARTPHPQHPPLHPFHPQDASHPQSPPTTITHPQSPLHQAPATSPSQPEQQRIASPIPSKSISSIHSPAKTQSAPTTPTKHQETPSLIHSAPTTPTHTKHSNTSPQHQSGPFTHSKKCKISPQSCSTLTTPTHTKHHETQPHSAPPSPTRTKHPNTPPQPQCGPSACIHSKIQKSLSKSGLSTTTPTKPCKTPPQLHSHPYSPPSQSKYHTTVPESVSPPTSST